MNIIRLDPRKSKSDDVCHSNIDPLSASRQSFPSFMHIALADRLAVRFVVVSAGSSLREESRLIGDEDG